MSYLCSFKFPVEFEFCDATCTILIQNISNLKEKPNEKDLDGNVVSFASQRPTLKLGRAFQEVSIEKIIELISISSGRVNLIVTDIDLKKILDRSPKFKIKIKDPIRHKCEDFIKVVKAAGCH